MGRYTLSADHLWEKTVSNAKQNRINRMINVLENSSSWISSSMLASLLGASERSIRNYVAEVNEAGTRHIESSKEGIVLLQQRRPPAMPRPPSSATPISSPLAAIRGATSPSRAL